jgi:drug/metabolite transporter (DMT)-like permease
MSPWLWTVALVPPLLYGVSNLISKVVAHGDDEDNNSWAILALGAIFDLVIFVPIGLYCYLSLGYLWPSADTFWPLFMNGATFTLAGWLFLQSVKTEDTSNVSALFQTIPAFGIFFGLYGLDEVLSWSVILGIIFLIIGGYCLSFIKGKLPKNVLVMMLLCCVLYAVNDFVIAKYGREVVVAGGGLASVKEALPAIMSDLLGKMFFGLIPLVSYKSRTSFKLAIRSKFKLVAAESVTYTLGDVSFDVAKILAPLAVVQALCCAQPLFILAGVILFSVVIRRRLLNKKRQMKRLGKVNNWEYRMVKTFLNFCHKLREKFDNWFWKMFGIGLMVVGGILLSI